MTGIAAAPATTAPSINSSLNLNNASSSIGSTSTTSSISTPFRVSSYRSKYLQEREEEEAKRKADEAKRKEEASQIAAKKDEEATSAVDDKKEGLLCWTIYYLISNLQVVQYASMSPYIDKIEISLV